MATIKKRSKGFYVAVTFVALVAMAITYNYIKAYREEKQLQEVAQKLTTFDSDVEANLVPTSFKQYIYDTVGPLSDLFSSQDQNVISYYQSSAAATASAAQCSCFAFHICDSLTQGNQMIQDAVTDTTQYNSDGTINQDKTDDCKDIQTNWDGKGQNSCSMFLSNGARNTNSPLYTCGVANVAACRTSHCQVPLIGSSAVTNGKGVTQVDLGDSATRWNPIAVGTCPTGPGTVAGNDPAYQQCIVDGRAECNNGTDSRGNPTASAQCHQVATSLNNCRYQSQQSPQNQQLLRGGVAKIGLARVNQNLYKQACGGAFNVQTCAAMNMNAGKAACATASAGGSGTTTSGTPRPRGGTLPTGTSGGFPSRTPTATH